MKKKLASILVGLILVFPALGEEKTPAVKSVNLGNVKIGFVNLRRAIEESERGKQILSSLQKEIDQAQAKLDQGKKEIEALEKEYKENKDKWDEATRQSKLAEIQIKKSQLGKQAYDYQTYYQKRQNEQLQPVINDLVQLIEEIGKKEKYAVIFDSSGVGVILYADPTLDLTDKIIKQYNLKK